MAAFPVTSPGSFDYNNTTDPRKLGKQQRAAIQTTGNTLLQQNQGLANQNEGQRSQTSDYLNQIENPIAQGKGGYNTNEVSQIELSPQDKQNIITGAGISAGAGTAAATGAAERAANAAGGNPLALGAYRARAADTQGALAGNAMTQARVGAQEAGAQEAANVGQTRLGQQDQALGYYTGQNQQANQNAQNAYNRQQQTYGTQTTGTNQAANIGLQASQTPTGFDKTIGAIGGALSALDDGAVVPGGAPAVVGEGGPERVVDLQATSDYLDDGGFGDPVEEDTPHLGGLMTGPQPAAAAVPWWQKLAQSGGDVEKQSMRSPIEGAAGGAARQQGNSQQQDYNSLGKGLGHLAGIFLQDGGVAPQGQNGVFTKPTQVNLKPGEAAVPLGYRAQAKTRPSMAMNHPPAKVTNNAFRARPHA